MNNNLKFATSSPNTILRDINFWKNQYIFIGIISVAIILITSLINWTYPKEGNWISYLSLPIHLIAIWGIYIAAKAISKIQVEHSIAIHIENKASEELRLIKNGEKTRSELDRIEEDFIPNNPYPSISMIRLFRHILKEAKDRKFESSVLVMQPYREETVGHLFKLNNIQKGALQLGILGTFIGLIGALQQLKVGTGGVLNIINFDPLFSSLHIAFSTSVAGLEVAIISGALAMLLHRKQEEYFQSMEDATVTMMSLARNSINKDDLFNEFGQIRSSIGQLTDRVYDQSQEVVSQTSEIQHGIRKLGDTKKGFDEFIIKIKEQQNNVINEIKETYNEIAETYKILSPENISSNMKESLEKSVEGISLTVGTQLKKDLSELKNVNLALIEINKTLEKTEQQILLQSKVIEKQSSDILETKLDFNAALKKTREIKTELVEEIDSRVIKMDKQIQEYSIDTGKTISKNLKSEFSDILKNFSVLNNELRKFNKSVSKLAKGKNIVEIAGEANGVFSWVSRLLKKG